MGKKKERKIACVIQRCFFLPESALFFSTSTDLGPHDLSSFFPSLRLVFPFLSRLLSLI